MRVRMHKGIILISEFAIDETIWLLLILSLFFLLQVLPIRQNFGFASRFWLIPAQIFTAITSLYCCSALFMNVFRGKCELEMQKPNQNERKNVQMKKVQPSLVIGIFSSMLHIIQKMPTFHHTDRTGIERELQCDDKDGDGLSFIVVI